MSTTTKNYGLIKPEITDAADVTATNTNWDKVDEQLKSVNDSLNRVSPNYVIEQNDGEQQKFWVGTKAEYDAIRTKDPNTSYTVTDEEDAGVPAESITGVLGVGNGGTGANNAANARKNLGVPTFYLSATEPTGWSNGDIWLKPVEE